jgi:hypothetical protein
MLRGSARHHELRSAFAAGMAVVSALALSVYWAHRVVAFSPLFVLAFECRGALIAKNAAETVRNVWICRLFKLDSFFQTGLLR